MLSAVLLVLAGLVLFIVLVVLILLCLPMRLDLNFNSTAKPPVDFRIAMLGGLLPLPMARGAHTDAPAKSKKKVSKKKRSRSWTKDDLLRLLRHLPRLLSRLIGTVKFESLRATFGFGFDNPADTGMVYGMLNPLERTIGNSEKRQIMLHPDFDRAKFQSQGKMVARFTPITIFPPLFSYGWIVFVKPRLPRIFR